EVRRPRDRAARLVPGPRRRGPHRRGGAAARRRPGPAPPLPAQRARQARGGAPRGGSPLRLEHRLAGIAGFPRGNAVPVQALGSRAARAGRVGAAAHPDGRDAGRGALPEPRRQECVRRRACRPRAGGRARRSDRDPLAPAVAPPLARAWLRPPLLATARVDRGARRPARHGERNAGPLGVAARLAEESARELSDEKPDLFCCSPLDRQRAAEWIVDLWSRTALRARSTEGVSLLDARSRFFDRSAAPARRGFGKLL